MYRLTPRTTPNGSSDGSHTFAQLHHKLSTGCNRVPHIHPQTYPVLLTNHQTQLHVPASSLDPSDLSFQTASISNQPFCHHALIRQAERQTNRWLEGTFNDYRLLLLYRKWQRGLIIIRHLLQCYNIKSEHRRWNWNMQFIISSQ